MTFKTRDFSIQGQKKFKYNFEEFLKKINMVKSKSFKTGIGGNRGSRLTELFFCFGGEKVTTAS